MSTVLAFSPDVLRLDPAQEAEQMSKVYAALFAISFVARELFWGFPEESTAA